ncbi:MliC family protein [Pseudoalteromonas arctica]|uniref:MliC family protein n=1 Tax=Pseudoalteromonas arctica TaxID=394751 RepID=UPI0024950C7C|nr:MliC family protein [Pseudoalteromonas arctica]
MKNTLIGILCGFSVLSCTSNVDDINTSKATKNTTFSCGEGGIVKAFYSVDGSQVALDVKLPMEQVDVKNVRLDQAISGSGARYINKEDRDVKYQWHTKADFALLDINPTSGKTISVSCSLN